MTRRERTLGLVLAHGGAQEAVERHIPVWLQNCGALMFFTPVDAPLQLPDWPQYSLGRSNAYSADTNERTRAALRFASYSDCEYVMLIEYDALIFGEIPAALYPAKGRLSAPKFTVPSGERCPGRDVIFEGTQFLHFPILFSIEALRATVDQMDKMSLFSEGGLTDRYVGYAAELAHVPVNDLWPTGIVYTKNHITTAMLPEAMAAIRAGARWHHGIKDKLVFEHLRQAYLGNM